MTTLVTGTAGFIGSEVAAALLARGEAVVGIDNLNDYYDVQLKRDRLARLQGQKGFSFLEGDIAEMADLQAAVSLGRPTRIIHLAAQAGVRYSLTNPGAYVRSNLVGHANVLELCRHLEGLEHLVYASSSSVYGGNKKLPFSESDRVDHPVSLYAATKKADELLSESYASLYGLPQTGLRFFTVYGPWGRPDMALWIFTKAILAGQPIPVFNHGKMRRDFTYIDDIVEGVLAVAAKAPAASREGPPHRLYNIGNNKPEQLLDMIGLLEESLARKAEIELLPMQPGDVPATYADIAAISRDFGFRPRTPIAEGIPKFVAWYRDYHGL
jgi:UDP-glucuronate 4-epimerase